MAQVSAMSPAYTRSTSVNDARRLGDGSYTGPGAPPVGVRLTLHATPYTLYIIAATSLGAPPTPAPGTCVWVSSQSCQHSHVPVL